MRPNIAITQNIQSIFRLLFFCFVSVISLKSKDNKATKKQLENVVYATSILVATMKIDIWFLTPSQPQTMQTDMTRIQMKFLCKTSTKGMWSEFNSYKQASGYADQRILSHPPQLQQSRQQSLQKTITISTQQNPLFSACSVLLICFYFLPPWNENRNEAIGFVCVGEVTLLYPFAQFIGRPCLFLKYCLCLFDWNRRVMESPEASESVFKHRGRCNCAKRGQ